MFTVKATYDNECRKLSFPECNSFPSFDQLYHQLYRVFPISHSIVLSKLLFSPDASKSRVLVSREVRSAEEYNLAVAPFLGKSWANPLLRFSVFEDIPHKLPAIALMSQPNASNPQKPVVSSAFPVASPLFGRISYSHIPPPPVIFTSRPSPQEPMDVESKALPSVPQPQQLKQDVAPCCAVSQTKKDIQELIAGFKFGLDSTIASLDKHSKEAEQVRQPTPPMVSNVVPLQATESTLSLPSAPVYPPLCQFNFCYRCGVIKQGAWFDCEKCNNKLCVTCHDTATPGDRTGCFVGTGPHVWNKRSCVYCETSMPIPPPLPPHPVTPWRSVPLNSFGSPHLPSVPTMPPVARDEPVEIHTPPPPVSLAVPAAEPIVSESARNNSGQVVHYGIVCDACHSTIEGIRHKCLDCPDYDLCSSCITGGSAERHNPFHEFFEISEPGRVVVHNVFSGRGEREANHTNAHSRNSEGPSPRSSQSVVHNATCNLCESRIRGDRYKCTDCPDYDVCTSCFSITEEHHPSHGFVKVLRPDDFIRREKDVQLHLATCNSCLKQISGTRYKCMHQECLDFDLCQDCEAMPIAVHPITHPLLKIKHVDTAIPLVYRINGSQPVAFDFAEDVRSRSPSSTPASPRVLLLDSPRALSPASLYESGFMRNPDVRVEGISTPEIPPPSPFYFRSESSRCQSPEYRYREVNRSPTPQSPVYSPIRRDLSPVLSRSPSPPMMIPGAMPTFFTLPPLKSLSPILRTPPSEANEPEEESRAPSPLWKHTPYSRPASYARSHSPFLIPGQYVPESHYSTRSPSPEPAYDYPVMAPTNIERNGSPAPLSPDWRQVYSPGSPFPVRLPSQSAAVESSHVLPPVHSSTTGSAFWPENFQEIRHLMEDEPSFSRDLRWSLAQSAENQPPIEESPLIAEGEALLTRPTSDTLPDSERSVRSLASILSNIQISATNPFITAMEAKEAAAGSLDAHIPPIVSLPSTPPEPLNAEYIADRSIPDGQVIAPGAEFLKAWVMRNGGNRAWPEDTELVFVAGESLARDSAAMQPKLVGAVQPMEQIDLWTGELKAPEAPGRYVSYYRLRDGEGNLFGHSIWLDITVSETFHRGSPDTLASSEEYMSSSSIIVMPHNAPTRTSVAAHDSNEDGAEQSPNSSMPGSPITAPSNGDDEISDSDSETSGSLLSVPDSDSDDELWQDSRTSVLVEGGDSQATLRAPAETQQPDEYVVLYDEATSSEEEE